MFKRKVKIVLKIIKKKQLFLILILKRGLFVEPRTWNILMPMTKK